VKIIIPKIIILTKTSKSSLLCVSTLFALLAVCLPAWSADPYAKTVVSSVILNGNSGNNFTNVGSALGASDGTFVSLGGPGASIMVDMGADTPVLDGDGPDLEVREIGAAFGGQDESYRVLVSNSTDTNTFQYVGTGRALSLIDIHPSGLTGARYIWLQDLATETLSSVSPGSDIDSLRAIYYSGSETDFPKPTGVSVRATGQGAWVSWNPVTQTNITSYFIRRSFDGVSFPSTPDATVSSQETAWHDTSLSGVSNLYYAVSAANASNESGLVIASLPVTSLTLMANGAAHLGDDTIPDWETPDAQSTIEINFSLPAGASGPEAELAFDLWDVDDTANAILVNGGKVGNMPVQTSSSWVQKTMRFAAGALRPGENTLTLTARTSSGGVNGALDDFQVRNISLRFYEPQSDGEIFTSTRITQINPGQTNVTLRWVVEQTPSLSPITWETVSSPIEWTGSITSSNGFYRLHEQP
jgi:hypothetical protein